MAQAEISDKWLDVSAPTSEAGEVLAKRIPANAPPALARVGMVVYDPVGRSGDYAVITEVGQEFATVRYEDGEVVALRWGQVFLGVVEPDPAHLR